eukprot:366036-Chlamydomonas_euryale.AAC.10
MRRVKAAAAPACMPVQAQCSHPTVDATAARHRLASPPTFLALRPPRLLMPGCPSRFFLYPSVLFPPQPTLNLLCRPQPRMHAASAALPPGDPANA